MSLRKPICKTDEIELYHCEKLNIEAACQLPSHRYVLERFYTLKIENRNKSVEHELALELNALWVFMNVKPKAISNIRYSTFHQNTCIILKFWAKEYV